jgi:hypothetical protein
MSQPIPAPVLSSDGNEGRWHYLYRAAAIAALIGVALFLFQIVAFFVWPPPSTVAGHFALLRSRPGQSRFRDHRGRGPCDPALSGAVPEPAARARIVDARRHRPLCGIHYLLPRRYARVEHAVPQPAVRRGHYGCGSGRASGRRASCAVGLAGNAVSGGLRPRVDRHAAHWVGDAAKPDLQQGHGVYAGIAASIVGFGVYVPKVGAHISIFSVVGMQIWYVLIALTLLRLSSGVPVGGTATDITR